MLPNINRLKKKKDFEKVFKEGKSFSQGFLFLKINKNKLNISRFGFIVSKKVSKKAPVRNKIKRRLREITRSKMPKIKNGIDCIIIVLSGLENLSFSEIEESINKIFKKAKIYV